MQYLTIIAQVQAFDTLNYKSKSTAALEIIVMLVGAFALGYLLHRLICRARHGETRVAATTKPRRATGVSTTRPRPARPDDLTVVEGIGPKINEILNGAGVTTYAQLADMSSESIKKLLGDAGRRYQVHDPGTWPRQAALARDGKMDELKELQDELTGGR
ncbi:hypothetical protein CR970_01275 [Candidatus Saccharibacteria bacterium]|nr:MAG: hypothetical protein CR970_01275 [Candidatus Saccharibacteria bacterium]